MRSARKKSQKCGDRQETEREIPRFACDTLFEPIRQARQAKSGKQAGDPSKAAQILLRIVTAQNPPVDLLLGTDAVNLVREKIEALLQEQA
jgi:hypothetical protein